MVKRFFYLCAGVLLLAVSWHLGARSAGAQTEARSGSVGRYAVIPEGSDGASAILLDTTTGTAWYQEKVGWTQKNGEPRVVKFWAEMERGFARAASVTNALIAADSLRAPRK
jgi:hypothetical protein